MLRSYFGEELQEAKKEMSRSSTQQMAGPYLVIPA
jgi:hypothetical protein